MEYRGEQIDEQQLIEFVETNVGFFGLDLTRISTLLKVQLFIAWTNRYFNVYAVTDVIKHLERVGRGTITREPTPYKNKPLDGLWHVHFFDANFMMENLINEWELRKQNSKKFQEMCMKVAKQEEVSPTAHGWQGRLTHEVVVRGFENKAKNKNLTGEWLIFGKHEGQNYYLGIFKHSRDKKGDNEIFKELKKWCDIEFPFLFESK